MTHDPEQYPEGQLNEHDEGVLNVTFRIEGAALVMDFGKPVGWIGFNKATALQLADTLRAMAQSL